MTDRRHATRFRRPRRATRFPALLLALALAAPACGADGEDADAESGDTAGAATDTTAVAVVPLPEPQEAFWSRLEALCGQAYEGEILESAPAGTDDDFAGQRMVMHVRECEPTEIRIPFHVGEDRSRTWVVTRTADGLRLKHDHRHEDGSPDALTMYGGDTEDAGSATRQAFPADEETAAMLPAAATNVWTLEVEPGQRFTYALRREGTDRRFRAGFDLTRPVDAPPAPWGWD